MPAETMLILRGRAGRYDGRNWPHGALYEQPALDYAARRGYVGRVLMVASGRTGPDDNQTKLALDQFRRDKSITALYGFSGGGYNVRHIIGALNPTERSRIRLVVVLGAPPPPPKSKWEGPWELQYRLDPPGGHMDGPRALLAELPPKEGPEG